MVRWWEPRKILVDVGQWFKVPSKIVTNTLTPDQVLYVKLTVRWGGLLFYGANERTLKLESNTSPSEVGCSGFMTTSTIRLLKELGIN